MSAGPGVLRALDHPTLDPVRAVLALGDKARVPAGSTRGFRLNPRGLPGTGAFAGNDPFGIRAMDHTYSQELFRYFLQNRDVLDSGENSWYGRAAQDITYHLSRHNSKEGSKKNISEHYDLGNDFYAEWLDP